MTHLPYPLNYDQYHKFIMLSKHQYRHVSNHRQPTKVSLKDLDTTHQITLPKMKVKKGAVFRIKTKQDVLNNYNSIQLNSSQHLEARIQHKHTGKQHFDQKTQQKWDSQVQHYIGIKQKFREQQGGEETFPFMRLNRQNQFRKQKQVRERSIPLQCCNQTDLAEESFLPIIKTPITKETLPPSIQPTQAYTQALKPKKELRTKEQKILLSFINDYFRNKYAPKPKRYSCQRVWTEFDEENSLMVGKTLNL